MNRKPRTKTITVKFTCPITKDEIHSVTVKTSLLSDEWSMVKIGKVGKRLFKTGCEKTHDLNIWCDHSSKGFKPLEISIYKLYSQQGIVATDTSNWTNCLIQSVSGDTRIIKKDIGGVAVFGYAE